MTSWQDFTSSVAQRTEYDDYFSLENPRMLRIVLKDQKATAKVGSWIASLGKVNMKREDPWSQGILNLVKKKVTGEGLWMIELSGYGAAFLADHGKFVYLFSLQDEGVVINGNDVLAFGEGISWDIKLMRGMSSILQGGFFNVVLNGTGVVAITTHGNPITIRVDKRHPVQTDPHATVAWSESLTPSLVTSVTVRTLLGRKTGEEIKMNWSGEGWVVIQPYEEIYLVDKGYDPRDQVALKP